MDIYEYADVAFGGSTVDRSTRLILGFLERNARLPASEIGGLGLTTAGAIWARFHDRKHPELTNATCSREAKAINAAMAALPEPPRSLTFVTYDPRTKEVGSVTAEHGSNTFLGCNIVALVEGGMCCPEAGCLHCGALRRRIHSVTGC